MVKNVVIRDMRLTEIMWCTAFLFLITRCAYSADLSSIYVPLRGEIEVSKACLNTPFDNLKSVEDFKRLAEQALQFSEPENKKENLDFLVELNPNLGKKEPEFRMGWTTVKVAFDGESFSESFVDSNRAMHRFLRTSNADILVSSHLADTKQIVHMPNRSFSFFETNATKLFSRNSMWFDVEWKNAGESQNLKYYTRPLGGSNCMIGVSKDGSDSIIARCFYGERDRISTSLNQCAFHLNSKPADGIKGVCLPNSTYYCSKNSSKGDWTTWVYHIQSGTYGQPVAASEFEQSVATTDLLVINVTEKQVTRAFHPEEFIADVAKMTTKSIEKSRQGGADKDKD